MLLLLKYVHFLYVQIDVNHKLEYVFNLICTAWRIIECLLNGKVRK